MSECLAAKCGGKAFNILHILKTSSMDMICGMLIFVLLSVVAINLCTINTQRPQWTECRTGKRSLMANTLRQSTSQNNFN